MTMDDGMTRHSQDPRCPVCGAVMILIHGSGWDYDRWYCVEPVDPSASIKVICSGEIELNDSTYPPGVADD